MCRNRTGRKCVHGFTGGWERGCLWMADNEWWKLSQGSRPLSNAAGTWEHASLPYPGRCQFGWASFRMGALLSRIHRRPQGSVSRQQLIHSRVGWNINRGHEGWNQNPHISSVPPYYCNMQDNAWRGKSGSLFSDCMHSLAHCDGFSNFLNWWEITHI